MSRIQKTHTKKHKLSAVQIFDLTESGNTAVVISNVKKVNRRSGASESQRFKEAARNNPWSQGRKDRAGSDRNETTTSKDPYEQLRKYVDALTRG